MDVINIILAIAIIAIIFFTDRRHPLFWKPKNGKEAEKDKLLCNWDIAMGKLDGWLMFDPPKDHPATKIFTRKEAEAREKLEAACYGKIRNPKQEGR